MRTDHVKRASSLPTSPRALLSPSSPQGLSLRNSPRSLSPLAVSPVPGSGAGSPQQPASPRLNDTSPSLHCLPSPRLTPDMLPSLRRGRGKSLGESSLQSQLISSPPHQLQPRPLPTVGRTPTVNEASPSFRRSAISPTQGAPSTAPTAPATEPVAAAESPENGGRSRVQLARGATLPFDGRRSGASGVLVPPPPVAAWGCMSRGKAAAGWTTSDQQSTPLGIARAGMKQATKQPSAAAAAADCLTSELHLTQDVGGYNVTFAGVIAARVSCATSLTHAGGGCCPSSPCVPRVEPTR